MRELSIGLSASWILLRPAGMIENHEMQIFFVVTCRPSLVIGVLEIPDGNTG